MQRMTRFAVFVSLAVLAGCGGGKDSPPGTPPTYSIRGHVSGATSVPVNLTGAATATVTTDALGDYSFTGLASGSYLVTPSLSGFAFNPASRSVAVDRANAVGQDFAASAASSLSGTVTGPWVEAITISLTGAAVRTTQTNASGQYSFDQLPDGVYYVTPSLTGYGYAPASPAVVILGANRTQDFAATATIASYAISGTVTNGGTSTGRIFVGAYPSSCTDCSPYAGTSLSAPGAYTIRGLAPGTYSVQARMDVVGNGARNASDPVGSASATIGSASVSGVSVALSDPTPPTPAAPSSLTAFPANGTVALMWDPPRTGGVEIAKSYEIGWGTDTGATNGGTVTVAARDDGHFLHGGRTDGAVLYYRIRALVGTTASAWTTPVSVTVGALTTPYTVSGSVTFTGTATGPLYVGLVNVATKAIRMTRYPAPTSSPVAFSVAGVAAGRHELVAIIDQNDDGVVGDGDISNLGASEVVSVSADTTGRLVALSSATVSAKTRTTHVLSAYSIDSYGIENVVSNGVKRPVAVTLFSGKNVAVPADVGYRSDFALHTNLDVVSPTAGDAYRYKVMYADGTSEVVSSTVTAVLSCFAQALVANGGSPYTAGVPMFSWAAPAFPPATYGYRLYVSGGASWWYPDSDAPLPSTTLGVLYDADGKASLATLTTGAYTWGVSTVDASGNAATREASYTVP